MKKILALLLVALMVVGMFAACGKKTGDESSITDPEKITDEMTSADGKYEIAFITDVGQLKDKSFNQGTYDGVKLYAANNNKSYKYYMPANGDQATDDDRINAVKAACDNGAKVVVAAGFMQEGALREAAKAYPDVSFIFIDGYPVQSEATQYVDGVAQPNESPVLKNIAGISFQEEQSGYLAGYAAVMEGYTKLGFTGGGGGTNPACQRFGYGFVQGVEAAAAAKGVKAEVKYSWLHGATFSASNDLQTMATGWYQNGTEVIFCCGGSMFTSVSAAAGAEDGKVVGVDIDQSGQSPTVITSATKGLPDATQWALGKFYEGKFSELGGVGTALGAKDNAVGLPTATWSLKNWKVADYEALFAKIKEGSVQIDGALVEFPASTANVTVIEVK